MKKCILIIISLVLGIHFVSAQSIYTIPTTYLELEKNSSFGTVHGYLEIVNLTDSINTMQWNCEYEQGFPSEWVVNFDEQNNPSFDVQDGDSTLFDLFVADDFPQKLIIGVAHNGVIGTGRVNFDIKSLTDSSSTRITYQIIINEASDPSDSTHVSTTDIDKISYTNIYPNPAREKITINTALFYNTVSIYNMLGQKVNEILDTEQNTIDITKLPKGEYFISLSDKGTKLYESKFIKE